MSAETIASPEPTEHTETPSPNMFAAMPKAELARMMDEAGWTGEAPKLGKQTSVGWVGTWAGPEYGQIVAMVTPPTPELPTDIPERATTAREVEEPALSPQATGQRILRLLPALRENESVPAGAA